MAVEVACLETALVTVEELARFRAMLPEDELAAAERMSDPRTHVCARALVRMSLSPDVAWTFARTEAGKPFVTGPIPAPAFSLSHTDGLVVVALGPTEVGVDVEPLARGPDLLATVLRAFAPAEIAALRALPDDLHARRAVELWTVKEAYLKALGTGIARHLDRFVVEPADDDASWRVLEAADWRVHTRTVADRWLVATAAAANSSIHWGFAPNPGRSASGFSSISYRSA